MVEEGMRAVEALCASRMPEELRDEIRIECTRRGKAITIVERRPPWNYLVAVCDQHLLEHGGSGGPTAGAAVQTA